MILVSMCLQPSHSSLATLRSTGGDYNPADNLIPPLSQKELGADRGAAVQNEAEEMLVRRAGGGDGAGARIEEAKLDGRRPVCAGFDHTNQLPIAAFGDGAVGVAKVKR